MGRSAGAAAGEGRLWVGDGVSELEEVVRSTWCDVWVELDNEAMALWSG